MTDGAVGDGSLMGYASPDLESHGRRPLRLRFPAKPENLQLIRRALEGMGLTGQVREDAVLLATELASNSIRHADLGPEDHVDVTAVWSAGVLRVVVRDSGSQRPPAGIVAGSIRPSPGGQSGWGLYLVDKLAIRWGTNLGGCAGFWFELEEARRESPGA